MDRKFKGFIVLTKAQHKQLLSEGFYIKADGTRVEQDKDYAYVSEDNVDLDELRLQVQENTENLVKKLDKKGGFIEENLTIMGNLTVKGTNFVESAETYTVKENVIVTNSEGQDIGTHLSGLAIKKNQSKAYGIMYDPANDGVKIGLGEVDADGEFNYDTDENGDSEGQFLATRKDNIPDKEIPQWDNTAKRFEGSGKKVDDFVERAALLDGTVEAAVATTTKKIKDSNGGEHSIEFVTQEQYKSLKESGGLIDNALYFITDDTTAEGIDAQLAGLTETVNQHTNTLAGILNGEQIAGKAFYATNADAASKASTADVLYSTTAVFEATVDSNGVAVININNNDKFGVYVIHGKIQTGVSCMGVVFAYPNMDMEGIVNNTACRLDYDATNKQIKFSGVGMSVIGMVAYQIVRVV